MDQQQRLSVRRPVGRIPADRGRLEDQLGRHAIERIVDVDVGRDAGPCRPLERVLRAVRRPHARVRAAAPVGEPHRVRDRGVEVLELVVLVAAGVADVGDALARARRRPAAAVHGLVEEGDLPARAHRHVHDVQLARVAESRADGESAHRVSSPRRTRRARTGSGAGAGRAPCGISGMPSIARLPRVTRSTSAADAWSESEASARTRRRVMQGSGISGRRLPQPADSADRRRAIMTDGGIHGHAQSRLHHRQPRERLDQPQAREGARAPRARQPRRSPRSRSGTCRSTATTTTPTIPHRRRPTSRRSRRPRRFFS